MHMLTWIFSRMCKKRPIPVKLSKYDSFTKHFQVVMAATGGLMGGQQIFRHDESLRGYVIKNSGQCEIRYTDDFLSPCLAILEDWLL